MLTSDFDFHLPAELIAQSAVQRGTSRLLVVDSPQAPSRALTHASIAAFPQLLDPGDLLVVNDTRVIPARLFARRRPGGGRVEILLAERLDELTWEVLVKPGRKARPGTLLDLETYAQDGEIEAAGGASPLAGVTAFIEALGDDGRRRLRFSEPIENHWDALGHVPLPPYIRRGDTAEDRRRYQTVWAARDGAIAAPTAGLHFDHAILKALEQHGVHRASITLHVGLGTFKPVTAELLHEHHMDSERWILPQATVDAIQQTQRRGNRVVAVGTTVVRALETAARAADLGIEGRPNSDGSAATGPPKTSPPGLSTPLRAGEGRSELFITPGFRFRVVDRLLTNFHLPRSTLLMLVSALAGRERVLEAYREAIEQRYRFYSYGDAMLLTRQEE